MLLLASCTKKEEAAKMDTSDSSAKMDYPYKIEKPDNWEIGSSENTMVALQALKAWEDGNVDQTLKFFGDSIHLKFDGLDKKISNDSLKIFFTENRNKFKSIKERVEDWESVISKDKSEEWVTLWYTDIPETQAGVLDSIDIVNDFKLKDGRIIRIDQYTRKLN
ncbi:hypothetical protein [Chryseobacterium sp. MP_3.2]|uniref:hypothetical protein n=1 Tax=Chryseobacterium sp. MP_3.2 TaxID=3071712 RepID=UPI002DFD0218|nr:hypothetical protein [Chryseobacterium sp. MP_3.2]